MVLGKLFRIYHKTDKDKIYSVLLENKNDKSETLLFESGAIGILCKLIIWFIRKFSNFLKSNYELYYSYG